MATWAIGDLQGCHAELRALLNLIGFDARRDVAWFTGDLVNRGADSLGALRAVCALGDSAVTVLGNHDLHLLACRYVEGRRPRPGDTLDDILAAPDCDELLDWLRRRPLLHHDAARNTLLVHAGLPPQWSIAEALALAGEVAARLAGPDFVAELAQMYGNLPDCWDDALRGAQRFRFIVNGLTRLRYVTRDGRLDLKAKGAPGSQGTKLVPWYAAKERRSRDTRIVFGHWSTLRLTREEERAHDVLPIDTGAVWGGALSAVNLDDGTRRSVPAINPVPPDGE
ncbi:MAG: symmetrical bis(5'-nucleosyl)-tetraphosphatase [Gammaproteobacteria bacterium]